MTPVSPPPLPVADLAALSVRLRRSVLTMAHRSRSGHLGSAFSCVDILITLYFGFLELDPAQPRDPGRDVFVLSKGHAASALYAVLAERGFFPVERLDHYLEDGDALPGHPSILLPGVEVSTGSLGHGLGIATGMALGNRMDGHDAKTVVLLSDGECDEASTWEAALFAAHHRLENLICIVDRNHIQGFGRTEDVLNLEPLDDKWRAFGWDVRDCDGHDHAGILGALASFHASSRKPKVLIARTMKGKGVSFMENTIDWHYWTPDDQHFKLAMEELTAFSLPTAHSRA